MMTDDEDDNEHESVAAQISTITILLLETYL